MRKKAKMKKSEVIQPEGNYYDKYHSHNPIVKWMMSNFRTSMMELLAEVKKPVYICEAGCGEGEISIFLHELYAEARIDAFDISEKVVREAKNRITGINFLVGDIYSMTVINPDEMVKYVLKNNVYNLVVCSEVLEHLENPESALKRIKELLAEDGVALLSVPNEPIWRILNILRGKYWKELGNTPGHIQHWSKKSFYAMLKKNDWNIIDTKSPFPWTMVLVNKR